MKWQAEKDVLLEEIRLVLGAIEKKSTIPTLSYFLVDAREETVQFMASDMELTFQTAVSAQVEKGGQIALPARVVADIVKSLPGDTVRFELIEMPRVQLKSGSTTFEVLGLGAEDYPVPQVPDLEDGGYVLPAHVLKRAIEYVDLVIPRHALREAFLGALLEKKGTLFSAAAMDVFRLAYFAMELESDAGEDFSLLVHRKALNELKSALAGEKLETVQFGSVDNLIVFQLGPRVVSIRMIDDQFPEYATFIPDTAPYRIVADRLALLEAFRRVVLLAKGTPDALSPSVLIQPKENGVELRFRHPATGVASDVVEAELQGEPFPVYVNGEFLIEFLTAADTESVELWFRSSKEPAAVRPAGVPGGQGFFYVYMPLDEKDVYAEVERSPEIRPEDLQSEGDEGSP